MTTFDPADPRAYITAHDKRVVRLDRLAVAHLNTIYSDAVSYHGRRNSVPDCRHRRASVTQRSPPTRSGIPTPVSYSVGHTPITSLIQR